MTYLGSGASYDGNLDTIGGKEGRMSKKRIRQTGSRAESTAKAEAGSSDDFVTIGTAVLSGIRDLTTGIEDHAATARFSLPISALSASPTDYRGRVFSSGGRFGGYVVSAAADAEAVHFTVTTGTVLSETRIEYLSHSGVPLPEIIWSMTQIGGLPDDGRFIQGFVRRPATFAVVVPIAGVKGDKAYQIGPVSIFSNRALPLECWETLAIRLMRASSWARARGRSSRSMPVRSGRPRRWGVSKIELALDLLAVGAQYSLAISPDGGVVPFVRESLFANPVALPLVLVAEKRTDGPSRRWLRDRSTNLRQVPASAIRVAFAAPEPELWPQFDEAVRAWRRAVLTTDAVSAVLALWEAIDFYASGISVPCLADKESQALRQAIDSIVLLDDQRQRVLDLLARINEAPLMVRLRAALKIDHVPFTEEDLSVLQRLRKQRNDALHGRQRGRPDSNDLDLARGFVDRMIVFWASGTRITASTR